MFVEIDEVYTHLYAESISAISGNDERLLLDALSTATEEVQGYLHAFDLDKLFGAKGEGRSKLLMMRVKDVAVYHYINIANPNINYNDRLRRYEYSIAWLKGVQKGDIVPHGFPKAKDEENGSSNSTQYAWSSRPKRENHI